MPLTTELSRWQHLYTPAGLIGMIIKLGANNDFIINVYTPIIHSFQKRARLQNYGNSNDNKTSCVQCIELWHYRCDLSPNPKRYSCQCVVQQEQLGLRPATHSPLGYRNREEQPQILYVQMDYGRCHRL